MSPLAPTNQKKETNMTHQQNKQFSTYKGLDLEFLRKSLEQMEDKG